MTILTPTTARTFWLALLENAARIIIDADALFPSPRTQSLIVLAQEEVGKAVWVAQSFRDAWYHGDETPHEVPELGKKAANHIAKLIAAADFGTMFVEVPGNTEPVEIELVKTRAPEVLDAYLKRLAKDDHDAKMSGFYVDLRADGTFTLPHTIERPLLRAQIWETADMIQWFLSEDHLFASLTGNAVSSTKEVESLLAAVLAYGPGDGL